MSKAVCSMIGGLALALLLGGCGKADEPGDSKKTAVGPAAAPEHYKDAVAKCETLSGEIGNLISTGKLSDVHTAAEEIKKLAEKMPEMAQKELEATVLKDVNTKAKELAGMFNEIDQAADAGKKDETQKLHTKMQALIAELKKHAR